MITIHNEKLKLTVDPLGAQMMALTGAGGTEYLWDGNEKYWPNRAPVLFPFIARLTRGSYKLGGRVYPMGIHGFAAQQVFEVEQQTESAVTLVLRDNDATREQYPFAFAFRVRYALEGNRLHVIYGLENLSQRAMPYAWGGHPGFRVPLEAGEEFSDYMLEFSQPCRPDRVGFTEQVYLNGHDEEYPLEDGIRIRLQHSLFDEDAIILKNMAREITLRSAKSGDRIRVTYPDMPYLGIWHMPKTDAGYVCIEPWSSLPSRQDVVEDLDCKSDMLRLAPGMSTGNCWTITACAE